MDGCANFFVPGCGETRGEVVTVENAVGPDGEAEAGAVGPITLLFFARALTTAGRDTWLGSWGLAGKTVTPGGGAGARFGASETSFGAVSAGGSGVAPAGRMSVGEAWAGTGFARGTSTFCVAMVGCSLTSKSPSGTQSGMPSYWAGSVSDNRPSERCCRICSSE